MKTFLIAALLSGNTATVSYPVNTPATPIQLQVHPWTNKGMADQYLDLAEQQIDILFQGIPFHSCTLYRQKDMYRFFDCDLLRIVDNKVEIEHRHPLIQAMAQGGNSPAQ